MGREKGLLNLSSNYELQSASPFDAREKVESKADLIATSTWTSTDTLIYTWKGMPVSVINDDISTNNGRYILMNDDYTVDSNWVKLSTSELSITFGANQQLPFMNETATDLSYSANLTFDGTDLNIKGAALCQELIITNTSGVAKYKIIYNDTYDSLETIKL